ncbi:MAG: protein-export chaperone SecB [Alphaproteobacteria bacterium]
MAKGKGKDTTTTKKNTGGKDTTTQNEIPTLPVTVHGQYIKDISFESPGPWNISGDSKEAPSINLNVEVRANPQEESGRFEVELHVTAEATRGGSTKVFVMELTYAGMFTLNDIPDQNIPPILLIECPRMLFPFARSIVADVTRDGGYPPLALAPVDFAEIYRRQLAQAQAQAQSSGKGSK